MVFGVVLSGCVMTEHALDKLEREVGERNSQRYASSAEAFRAQGYTFIDEQQYAHLDDDALRQCKSALMWGRVPAGWAEMQLQLWVAPAVKPSAPPPVPNVMRALAPDVCNFFGMRTHALEGQLGNGSAAKLIRMAEGVTLARDRAGTLVMVHVQRHVVSRRKVRIKKSCNLMPRVEPDPLDMPIPSRVLFAETLPPRVDMSVEYEQLDVACTDNVY